MNPEGSDDNEHDKQSYSSTVDDMRSISETTSKDEPMNDSVRRALGMNRKRTSYVGLCFLV
ncbi:hypothetical protein OUZ56_025477 [Daphnia magna]|uniref:Uncharacterized protein n=1 Tax=Daphnia magna TaxID=35525 RepID=A0ABQ9ZJZ0_9CRUS|nr:hypothetical protein OUZ56_025477 [Daphnia magna]